MTPIFKLGPGAPIGSDGKAVAEGRSVDELDPYRRYRGDLSTEHRKRRRASGPLNGTAPNPVRNAEFAKTFSSVLKKPYTPWRVYVPFGPPDGLLRVVLGEVATIITTGQRVLPTKPLELGYHFKYPHIADALRAVFTPAPPPPQPRPTRGRPTPAPITE